MLTRRLRNVLISLFVILWTILFHYESTRHFYLEPWLGRPLPMTPFLFPPAGWIMFFNVDDQFGYVEVYGFKNNVPQLIDPHQIVLTRDIGYDNIHRNILSDVASSSVKEPFCRYLQRKFPYFDGFVVTSVYYPSLTQAPHRRVHRIHYTCP
jgi:hypothetical protein